MSRPAGRGSSANATVGAKALQRSIQEHLVAVRTSSVLFNPMPEARATLSWWQDWGVLMGAARYPESGFRFGVRIVAVCLHSSGAGISYII